MHLTPPPEFLASAPVPFSTAVYHPLCPSPGETVPESLPATPKVPRHAGVPRGEHRGSRHRFLCSDSDRRVPSELGPESQASS